MHACLFLFGSNCIVKENRDGSMIKGMFWVCSNIPNWSGEEANAVRGGWRTSTDIQERLGRHFQTDHTGGRSFWALQGNITRILQSHSKCWYCVYDIWVYEADPAAAILECLLGQITVLKSSAGQLNCRTYPEASRD